MLILRRDFAAPRRDPGLQVGDERDQLLARGDELLGGGAVEGLPTAR